MKHSNNDMLLRIAQGDAYCLGSEYIKFPRDEETFRQVMKFEKYVKHPTHKLRAGDYSDDTQMSIAVAEVLIENANSGLLSDKNASRHLFAERFVTAFKRDQRDGYARGFQKLLESIENGEDLLRKIRPDSDKNGAAMRSVPLGVIRDISLMFRVAETQAKITHDTEAGILSSQAVALMSHFALWEDGSLDVDMYDWCVNKLPEFKKFQGAWSGPVKAPNVGINTVHAVATLMRERTLIDILRKTIVWGGDTDSVASIAWGIASVRMKDDLPEFFLGGLEKGRTYGVNYLKDLGTKLMSAFGEET